MEKRWTIEKVKEDRWQVMDWSFFPELVEAFFKTEQEAKEFLLKFKGVSL